MFVYLSKKIAIPNNIRLHCVSWNKEHGYIACGGDDGLLKVLKLESGKVLSTPNNASTPSNLSLNQTLDGHNGAVQVVTWNEGQSQKLTSSDQYGLITVWMLYKGSWYEEMINNRNKSVVTDMVWNAEGQRICIVYEDGAVIVGSVDGNRIWGRELKGMSLTHAEWSPDGRRLLFGLRGGDVHVFDHSGNAVGQIRIRCFPHSGGAGNEIAGLQWYNGKGGYVEPNCPCLVVCYKSGHMQIMRGEDDDDPVLLEGGFVKAVAVRWNGDGSILALAGTIRLDEGAGGKECNVVQFYTPHGELLRTLKVPGKQIADCSWEGGGLRLALAIDSFIYFANIRPDYKWCYFANSVVHTYTKSDRSDVCVVFWDTKNNQRYVKFVKHLVAIATGSKSEYCVLSTRADEDDDGRFALVLCNAIGTPVDSKYADLAPTFLSMSPTVILAASKDRVAVWCYRTPQVKTSLNLTSLVDDEENYRTYGINQVTAADSSGNPTVYRAPSGTTTQDPICCVCNSDTVAMVARESGLVHQFVLPQLTLVTTHVTAPHPHRLAINCNATRVSVIDGAGAVSFLDLEVNGESGGETVPDIPKRLDRKDVWDVKWSVENAELFVLMEKTRMYVFRNLDPEEPIVSNGHVCSFEDLQIKTVLLDEVLKNPESPTVEMVVDVEVKSLRDTRQLLEKVGLADALQFVEDNSHPRLWRLLAEAALDAMDLTTAESAFVRCKDYPAIVFVKSLRNIQNEKLRRAEVAAHFHRFDEAEKLYVEMDRRDLAVALRRKLGDWFRVVQLLKSGGGGGDDAIYAEAWNAIGDYYADRQRWEEAVRYYEQGRNVECQARCHFAMEDYAGLEKLSAGVPEGDKLLSEIADMFATMGMCEQAVSAFIRDGNIKKAIDCCVTLNNWGKAVELAEKHHVREIGPLMSKYARHLLDKGKVSSAVELYRKAGKFLEAARLVCKTAREAGADRASPLHVKKLYVLGGLLMEDHRHRQVHKTGEQRVSSVISGLLEEEQFAASSVSSDDKLLDGAWQGAEAYHFYLMAQRQLYGGLFDAAMKTALHLQDFENVIDAEEVFLLIALASCANRNFHVCSQAFIKLESLESISKENQQQYEMLAMEIFVKHSPQDLRTNLVECPTCGGRIPDWCNACSSCNSRYPVCTVTGCPLLEQSSRWTCHRCKRCASVREMTTRKMCPLCHASV